MKENISGSLEYKHFKDEQGKALLQKNEASKVREIKPQSKNHEVGSEGCRKLLMKRQFWNIKKETSRCLSIGYPVRR